MYVAIIDIVFVALIIIFVLRCAFRGFIKELLSMAALVIGLLVAIFFFRRAALVISDRFAPETKMLPEVISFAILFLVTFIAIKLIETLVKNMMGKVKLTGLDRFLGIIYGFAEGVVVVYLLMFLINIQPFVDPDLILGRSIVAEKLMEIITGYKKGMTDTVVLLGEALKGIFTVV